MKVRVQERKCQIMSSLESFDSKCSRLFSLLEARRLRAQIQSIEEALEPKFRQLPEDLTSESETEYHS